MSYNDDIYKAMGENKLNVKKLSDITGIPYQSLAFFIRKGNKIGGTVAERLIPFIYGDRRSELGLVKQEAI